MEYALITISEDQRIKNRRPNKFAINRLRPSTTWNFLAFNKLPILNGAVNLMHGLNDMWRLGIQLQSLFKWFCTASLRCL